MVEPGTIIGGINAAANLAGAAGSFFGGGAEGLSRQDQRFMADKSWRMAERQQDFLENQMVYRTNDAIRAGIHPLAAIGVNPASGGSISLASPSHQGKSLGDKLQDMGQHVSRAASAYQTPEQRALVQLELEKLKNENDLIKANTAATLHNMRNIPGNPPAQSSNPNGNGDVVESEQMWYKRPDGSLVRAFTPQYAASLMSDPWEMRTRSLERWLFNRFGVPIHSLYKNLSRTMDWSDPVPNHGVNRR